MVPHFWWQPHFNDKKCREGERIKTVIIAESPKNPKSNSFQNTSARWRCQQSVLYLEYYTKMQHVKKSHVDERARRRHILQGRRERKRHSIITRLLMCLLSSFSSCSLHTLWCLLEEPVLLIGTVLLFSPIFSPKYKVWLLIGSIP